jgi:hypothetical protein
MPRIASAVADVLSVKVITWRQNLGIYIKRLEDIEMTKVLKERRANKGRITMSLPCIVSTDSTTADDCTTIDLGKGGMCIFSNKSLEVGHIIKLQCEDIWDSPKTGTVKWCKQIQINLYRIGIVFS